MFFIFLTLSLALIDEYNKLLQEYNTQQEEISKKLKEYEVLESSIEQLMKENEISLSRFDLKRFVSELNLLIEEQLNKPRNEVIKEMINSKELSGNTELLRRFKDLSINFHKFSIIRDKLNHKAKIQEQIEMLNK